MIPTPLKHSTRRDTTRHDTTHARHQSNGTKRLVAERGTLDGRRKEGRVRDLCVRERLRVAQAALFASVALSVLDWMFC